MKVDGSFNSVLQGVSQQPRRARLPGQSTEQINMSSDPVLSLNRRPPLDWVESLFEYQDDVQWFTYNRFGQIFFVACYTGGLRIFDLEGTEFPVRYDDNSDDYLESPHMAFTSIDDTLFVVNTSTIALMADTVPTYAEGCSVIYLLGSNYGKTYKIDFRLKNASGTVIGTSGVAHTTPNGNLPAHALDIATTKIAQELYNKILLLGIVTGSYVTAQLVDDHILIKVIDPTLYSVDITVSDDAYGTNMKVMQTSAPSSDSLSKYAVNGQIVEIVGTNSSLADNWYLQFKTVDPNIAIGSGFGRDGYWIECAAPNVVYKWDKTTMPHVLRYDFDEDEFYLAQGEWEDRKAGNNESNRLPSIVGNSIRDVSVLHGRLTMISGVNKLLSATNEPFRLFKASATATVDSDPIDISSTATDLAEFERIIPHNRDLFIFADGGQFMMPGRNPITPSTAVLVKTTGFNANLAARPVSSGQSLFFAVNYGEFTGIREFYTVSSGELDDSRPITEHVLRYMPGRVSHMACSSNFDTLLVSTTKDKQAVYVYEYVWNGDEKVQSSWSKWQTRYPIEFFTFIEGSIYFILNVEGQFVLHVMDLDLPDDMEAGYSVRLDSKRRVVGGPGRTLVIPDALPIDDLKFVGVSGVSTPGMALSVDSIDYDTREVTFRHSIDGVTIVYGYPFLSSYTPTMPYIPDEDGSKISTGTLQIRNFILQLSNSGSFWSKITSKYFDDVVTYHTPRFINDVDTLCGVPALSSTTISVPFMNNADYADITFFTDGVEPFTILDIEWTGDYRKRGQRISRGVQ